MDCSRAEAENIVERYISGKLSPAHIQQFEEHYFECNTCAQRVDDWCQIDLVLRQERRRLITPNPVRAWIWTAAAIAAMVLIGFSGRRPAPPPPPAMLAQLEPPQFLFPVRRGAFPQWEYQFQEAMRSYPIHDYGRTIEGLTPVVETWPSAGAPRFFLGACELLAGRPKDAIRELRAVASGDSPFAEQARFYLAHAYLQEGRKIEAIEVLRQLSSAGGEFSTRATEILKKL
jgi:anti-sigma factor RsiW